MKRQIFTLSMVLVLATGTVLMAQSNANQQVPPSQQVDHSGKPEQTGKPDIDVDTGKNAKNGVLNVEVKRHGDSDTKAGNNPNGNKMGTAGTTGTNGTYTGSTTSTGATSTGMDNSGTGVSGSRSSNLPRTASDMPLFGLLGALSLAGALGLRKIR